MDGLHQGRKLTFTGNELKGRFVKITPNSFIHSHIKYLFGTYWAPTGYLLGTKHFRGAKNSRENDSVSALTLSWAVYLSQTPQKKDTI